VNINSESPVRSDLPADVVAYLDGLGRRELSGSLASLSAVADEEGFSVAAESARRLVARGAGIRESDLRVLSLRVLEGGETAPGPDLGLYDRALLGGEVM